jgi:hypothetical protein
MLCFVTKTAETRNPAAGFDVAVYGSETMPAIKKIQVRQALAKELARAETLQSHRYADKV